MSQIIEVLKSPLLEAPLLAKSGVAGRATIASGSSAIAVTNAAVAADSIIVLTSNTDTASHIDLIATVGSQAAGVGFTINVQKATVGSHVVAWQLIRAS